MHEILRELDTVMLTTVDERLQLVSRPMVLHVGDDFDGTVHLFAPRESRVVANINGRASVNISHVGAAASISLAGQASIVTDTYETAVRWHNGLNSWFQHGRAGVVLIEVTVFEGRCWKFAEDAAQQPTASA
ncbi:pyridoxamine 5'-phosphate oxidase family protein [Nocardia sp. NPDC058633]|uniref:pyridoxamine 5'-phosphate oxidase family protein n=1 Tax=Nocardia sp. NPDC058633 TaxID=3346568 RepID=UPI00364BFE3B